jgi:hypothetical protein
MAQAQSLAELEQIRSDCLQLVRKRAGISAGVAVVPLPGMDMLADVAVFSEMLETINTRLACRRPTSPGLIRTRAAMCCWPLVGSVAS